MAKHAIIRPIANPAKERGSLIYELSIWESYFRNTFVKDNFF